MPLRAGCSLGQDIRHTKTAMRPPSPCLRALCLALLLAGCATTPEDDGLLASTALVNRLPLEEGRVIEVARFSRLQPGGPLSEHWEPYTLQPANPYTQYRPAEVAGRVCVEADATNGYSALQRLIRIDPRSNPIIEWRWNVPHLATDGKAKKPTPRARIMVAFHGDEQKLDFEQRVQLRMAKAVTGRALPYSSLIYVWLDGVPEGRVVPSPYTERVRLIAMDTKNPGRWVTIRRNVREDYRRAFGGEEPGDIVGVGIFTDVDGDGAPGRAYYGDISFLGE